MLNSARHLETPGIVGAFIIQLVPVDILANIQHYEAIQQQKRPNKIIGME
jgi:hypothetical protein